MKTLASILAVGIAVFFPVFSLADTATSTSFKIDTGVIDAGGSRATSSGFNLNTSIGEPATGISTSSNFILRGGFLQFPAPVSAVAATSAGAGDTGGNSGFVSGPGALPSQIPLCSLHPADSPLSQIDVNCDGRVDIQDLSILLFFYNRTGSAIARYDFNRNSTVDFPDASVMMFYWTG